MNNSMHEFKAIFLLVIVPFSSSSNEWINAFFDIHESWALNNDFWNILLLVIIQWTVFNNFIYWCGARFENLMAADESLFMNEIATVWKWCNVDLLRDIYPFDGYSKNLYIWIIMGIIELDFSELILWSAYF